MVWVIREKATNILKEDQHGMLCIFTSKHSAERYCKLVVDGNGIDIAQARMEIKALKGEQQ